jgi:hypothetical protein
MCSELHGNMNKVVFPKPWFSPLQLDLFSCFFKPFFLKAQKLKNTWLLAADTSFYY